MLQTTFLNDTGNNVISSLAVGSGQTITTQGVECVNTNFGLAGLFIIHNGTVNSVTREVSYDNTTFYTPWDKSASLGALITTSANNSRFLALNFVNSGNIVSPYVRYNVTMLSGGTLSLIHINDEK